MPRSYSGSKEDFITYTDYIYGFTSEPVVPPLLEVRTYPGERVQTYHTERVFSGERTSNWKRFQKENGYLPTTRCSDIIRESEGKFTKQLRHSGDPLRYPIQEVSCAINLGYPSDNGFPNEYVDVAAIKLQQKLAQSDFNLGVTAAEAEKTLDFVVDKASTYAKAYRAFRHGNFGRAAQLLDLTSLKGAASNWLSYKFGWGSLLLDAKSAAENAARRTLNQTGLQHFTASNFKETNEIQQLSNNADWQAQTRVDLKRSYLAKCWVTVKVENPNLRAAAELGLTNPLAVAWELTPFSWVADYFMSIGSYLQTLSAFDGLTVLDSGWSWRRTDTGTYYQGLGPYRIGERRSTFKQMRFERHPGVWSPPLSSAFRVSADLSLNQLVTVTALIRQIT